MSVFVINKYKTISQTTSDSRRERENFNTTTEQTSTHFQEHNNDRKTLERTKGGTCRLYRRAQTDGETARRDHVLQGGRRIGRS